MALLAWWRRRGEAPDAEAGAGLDAAFAREARALAPLLLRPAITLLALVSVALQPAYPYAFTLPVALTQDWGIAQDLLALAAIAGAPPAGARASRRRAPPRCSC